MIPAPLTQSDMNELKQCRHGYMLYNKHDQYVGQSFLQYGEFSEKEIELFDQIIQPGMIVLDIGANIGAHTLYFANKVGLTGAVIAFEPQRVIFQTLCANMALNNVTHAICFHAAVSKDNGSIMIPSLDYHREGNYGGLSLGQFQQGESVQVMTIDSMQLPQCQFMKIDVEGMEKDVLLGARNTIEKHSPIIYAENDREEKSSALIALLMELDYKLYWHLPPLYNPNNFFKNATNIFGSVVSVNMLCLPNKVKAEINGLVEIKSPNDTWRS